MQKIIIIALFLLLPVPVFAIGNGASSFEGYYDNTDIYRKLASLTGVM